MHTGCTSCRHWCQCKSAVSV